MKIPSTYVDWHCPDCGFQHETDKPTHSYPVYCPCCGKDNIAAHRTPSRPVNRVWCDSYPKQYDFLGGSKQIQVCLKAATGEQVGQTFDPDVVPDCDDDPIYVAEQVLIRMDKDRVRVVVEAMKACEEESARNLRYNHLHRLRRIVVESVHEYNVLLEAEEDDSKPTNDFNITPNK